MENNGVAETVERVGASTHPTLAPYGAYRDYQKAETLADKALALSSIIPVGKAGNKAKELLQTASQYYKSGKFKEAENAIRQALSHLQSSQMQMATPNGAKMPNNAMASKSHDSKTNLQNTEKTSIFQGTVHGNERLTGRGFSQERLQNIVDNYSEKGYQPGGKTVYIQKRSDNYYDVLIVNADNMVVTAVGGTVPPDKFSLPNRKAVMKMLNNNGGFSGIPVQ